MRIPRFLPCAALLLATALHAQTAPANTTHPAPCKPEQLSLATDQENGSFDGMSHSGTLLVLRNISDTACTVPPFPQITFADAKGPLTAKGGVASAKFMHPGPVVQPPVIAPGAELTSKLTWVSGEVFTDNLCISPTKLTLQTGTGTLSTDLAAHICSERANGVGYQMTRFLPDPVSKR